MRLQEKQNVVEDLHERFARSKIVIVTDYKGLNVAAISDLRGKLKAAGIEYSVVKNSLLVRASEETGVACLADFFKGPSAVAISYDDPVAPAKVLTEFAKGNDKFDVKAGAMDGKLLDLDQLKALSSLPSREELLGQLLATMNAVPTNFVRVLYNVPSGLLNVLQAIKDKKEAA